MLFPHLPDHPSVCSHCRHGAHIRWPAFYFIITSFNQSINQFIDPSISHYSIFRAATSIARMTLSLGMMVATGMERSLSTVGLTMGAQTRAEAPSLSALIAAMMASSIVVAEYSRRVSILSPIFIFFSDILSRTGRAAMMAIKFPSEPSSWRIVFTICRRVVIFGSLWPDKILYKVLWGMPEVREKSRAESPSSPKTSLSVSRKASSD